MENYQKPGTSKDFKIKEIANDVIQTVDQKADEEQNENQQLIDAVNIEDFLDKNQIDLIEYEKQMLLDVYHSDSLCVTAKGISCERVVSNLIKVFYEEKKMIIVLNSSDYEENLYKMLIGDEFIQEIPANQTDRQHIYNHSDGCVLFMSTQVLVVDLLRKKIPVDSIAGIIVLRAHTVIESCQEAFALRLYRQSNKKGFIKAFSNSVEAFMFGYGHVEKVMRNLFIRELFIWPRFHATIQQTLKKFEPTVVEFHIPMTAKMTAIQTHILDIMNYTVRELKNLNRFLDLQEVTVENCVTKKFHKILQAELDCVWHQLSSHTKLLVSDLKVLRSLMLSTIYSDSVSLFVQMRKYRTKEYAMQNSGWILLDAAEKMFKTTKDRIFNEKGEFEPELPAKWKALSEILRVEIPADLKRHKVLYDPVKVLILCSDNRTCYQVNELLTQGGERSLFYMALTNAVQISGISDNFKHCSDLINSVKVQKVEPQPPKPLPPKPKDPPAQKKSFLIDRLIQKAEDKKSEEVVENPFDKKEESDEDLTIFRDSYFLTMSQLPGTNVEADDHQNLDDSDLNATLLEKGEFESFHEMENLDITSLIRSRTSAPIVCIQTFKSQQNGLLTLEQTMTEINPKYIIMYHANVSAIRQIEVFEARQNRKIDDRLKVFFLLHAGTVEEQSYLTNLRREKQAFEMMIDRKASMVIPEYQDGKTEVSILKEAIVDKDQTSTRQAGGQLDTSVTKVQHRIIVDIREFRSDLPCLIHKRGIEVMPVMITIGDYILTPDVCVERKSISDLIGSLNSGRLYNQCVQMSRFYAKPILLIEFDQNKPFHLQGNYMISSDATSNSDITHKIQLLTLHFPKLKLVWSPSPYATVKLFEELKVGKPEPDVDTIAAIGSENSEMEVLADRFNTTIYDFLLKLPGINPNNIGKLMKNVKDFNALLKKNESELEDLLNGKQNAKMLWEILHIPHKAVENDSNDKMHFMAGRKYGATGNIRGKRKFK